MAIKNLVSGGAGFLGSHLIDRLLANGEEVFCLDNYITGQKKNISHKVILCVGVVLLNQWKQGNTSFSKPRKTPRNSGLFFC